MHYREAYRVFELILDSGVIIDEETEIAISDECLSRGAKLLTRDCLFSDSLLIRVGGIDAHGTLESVQKIIIEKGSL